MAQATRKTRFETGPVKFIVRHELWDENIQDHADQGVSITVASDVAGKETALLRFNCFDIERSYIYGPEDKNKLCRMDPIVDGNPIGWSIRQLRTNLPKMLTAAGYEDTAAAVGHSIEWFPGSGVTSTGPTGPCAVH